jgi:proteasome alpha subunit
MAYTPYDWQQTLRQRADYAEDRLWRGSPVVGISCREGILLLTTRQTQRKIFEIYDRLAFAGLGNPSDLEAVRQAAVDFAHAEGYQRSEQDVSIQRVIGFAISPVLKRAFADPLRTPLVICGLFAQVGDRPAEDVYFVLNYDGEYLQRTEFAAAAGTPAARREMERLLSEASKPKRKGRAKAPSLEEALPRALDAWATGRWALHTGASAEEGEEGEPETPSPDELKRIIAEALEAETLEAALLERDPSRERRLNVLSEEEWAPYLP